MASSSARRLRLDDQLCFALYAATNAVTRAYRPLLGALSLTYPQYLVMLTLWQDGALSARQVADRLQLGANAITPLVDQLEAAGLVTRTRSKTDRRIIVIALSEAGARMENDAAIAQEAVVCRTGLEEGALAALREDLSALISRMAAAAVSPADACTEENA